MDEPNRRTYGIPPHVCAVGRKVLVVPGARYKPDMRRLWLGARLGRRPAPAHQRSRPHFASFNNSATSKTTSGNACGEALSPDFRVLFAPYPEVGLTKIGRAHV